MTPHHGDELLNAGDRIVGSRRALGRAAAGGALVGLAGRLGFGDPVAAKRKRKKGDRCFGPRPVRCSPTAAEPLAVCYPRGAICCGSALGGGACPPGSECCAPEPVNPTGSCAPPGNHCCPPAIGGYCPQYAPTCCPATIQDPLGLCIPTGFRCCTGAQGGGSCRDDETCCPPSAGFPNGSCAPPGWDCPPRTAQLLPDHPYRDRRQSLPEDAVAISRADPRL